MFRFGNGASELSKESIEMPVCLAERAGTIRAAIVKGDAPLLLSRPAMKRLSAEMDFSRDELRLFNGSTRLPMQVNAAGQYMIPVTEFPQKLQPVESPLVAQESLTVGDVTSEALPIDAHEPDAPTQKSVNHEPCPVPKGDSGNECGGNRNNGVTRVGKKGKSKDYWVIRPAARRGSPDPLAGKI